MRRRSAPAAADGAAALRSAGKQPIPKAGPPRAGLFLLAQIAPGDSRGQPCGLDRPAVRGRPGAALRFAFAGRQKRQKASVGRLAQGVAAGEPCLVKGRQGLSRGVASRFFEWHQAGCPALRDRSLRRAVVRPLPGLAPSGPASADALVGCRSLPRFCAQPALWLASPRGLRTAWAPLICLLSHAYSVDCAPVRKA